MTNAKVQLHIRGSALTKKAEKHSFTFNTSSNIQEKETLSSLEQ